MGDFRALIKDSFVYGGVNALTKLFSLFLTPLMTYQLTAEQFGTLDFYNPLISLFLTLSIFGLDSAVARFLYLNENEWHRKSVVKSAFLTQTLITTTLCVTLLLSYSTLLKPYFKDSPIFAPYMYMVFGIFAFTSPFRFVQNLLIWRKERNAYLKISIAFLILNFGFIVSGIFLFNDKVLGVLCGQFLAVLLVSFYAVAQLKPYAKARFDKKLTIQMLTYSSPLLLGAFVPALIPAFERYFINTHLSLVQVAHYGIGYRLASLLLLPLQSLNTAIGPFVLSMYKQNNSEQTLNVLASMVLVVGILMITALVIGAKWILPLLAPAEYSAGLIVVGPLGVYFLLDNVRSLVGVGIDLSMKTFWVIGIYVLTISILFVLLSWLTPLLGLTGVAYSLAGYGLLSMCIFTLTGNKLQSIRFNLFRIILISLIGAVLVSLIPHISTLLGGIALSMGLIILIGVGIQFECQKTVTQVLALIRTKGK